MSKRKSDVKIRNARSGDLPRLLEIYNHYIEQTHITFDTEPSTLEAKEAWFRVFEDVGPHVLLVAESEGVVAGYASSREFWAKAAYSRSVETSIDLAAEATGAGLGTTLYSRLIETLEAEESVHRAYGGITVPNQASIALHERVGFKQVASFSEVGFKFGRYWDVVWFERCV